MTYSTVRHALVLCALLLAVAPAAAQSTWFVDASAVPPGSGTPGSPYASLQFALAQPSTQDGDTLSVSAGVYQENIDFLGKAVTVEAAGPGAVIDGGQLGPAVSFVSGEGPGSILRGFLVRNGVGGAVPIGFSGGAGVRCLSSSPSLESCRLESNGIPQNCDPEYGGGLYVHDSSPVLFDCELVNNFSCEGGGAAVIFGDSSPAFVDCRIDFNHSMAFPAAPPGAGVLSQAVAPAMPTFQDCSFTGNQGGKGPALSGRSTATDCTFSANRGTGSGGAVYSVTLLTRCLLINNELFCDGSGADPTGAGAVHGSILVDCDVIGNRGFIGGGVRSCTVIDSRIVGNTAMYFGCEFGLAGGGGAADSDLVNCEIRDNVVEVGFGPPNGSPGGGISGGAATGCLIADNLADRGGGAYFATLERCTLTGNMARDAVDGGDHVLAHNSIIWGNGSIELDPLSTATWSDVRGGFPGVGNLAVTPGLWLATGGDWLLKPTSPCIDAGDPSSPLDPDGSRVDMGYRPFDATHTGAPSTYCLPTTSSNGCLARMTWSGSATLSGPDDFHVKALFVESARVGLLFWGRDVASIPFAGGSLCIQPPLTRTLGQFSGGGPGACQGSFDFHFTQLQLGAVPNQAFDSLYAQSWYRDPAGTGGVGLSDALEFVLLP